MKMLKYILLLSLLVVLVVDGCSKPDAEVKALAEEIGVDPRTLDSYGPGPFPLNYFLKQLCPSSCKEESPTRDEVQAVISGFEIERECQYTGYNSQGDYSVIYLYDSSDFDSALKIVAIYRSPENTSSSRGPDILVGLFYLDSPTQAEISEWRHCVASHP